MRACIVALDHKRCDDATCVDGRSPPPWRMPVPLHPHLCDDGVINNAAALIGEHAQRSGAISEASNIPNDETLQEANRVLALRCTRR